MKKLTCFGALLFVFLVACSREEPTPTPAPTATVGATAVATPHPATATPSPSPTATPVVPQIVSQSQPLALDGHLTIAQVTAVEPSWLVVQAILPDKSIGEVLGVTAVAPGSHQDVAVTISALSATDTVSVMLYADKGKADLWEPEKDKAVANFEPVTFAITPQFERPSLIVSDQTVAEDGLVHIDEVISPVPAWVVVQADVDGKPGPLLGFTLVTAVTNSDIPIHVDWHQATPTLHIGLFQDNGRLSHWDDFAQETPLLSEGQAVATAVHITLPFEIVALDQPIVNNQIVVERVISNGPGWLAVQFDNDGTPGLIIGSAPLHDGLNEQVQVDISGTPSRRLFLSLYTDTEPIGQFNYPVSDAPVRIDGRLPNPFVLHTNFGSSLLTQDQSFTDTVTIPLTISDLSTWVVVYNSQENKPNEVIGQTWLAPGINRNIQVEIKADQATPLLFVVLHQDGGTLKEFEYPDGADTPLRLNQQTIQAPFSQLK